MKKQQDQAKFNNVPVTQDTIRHWVKKDIETLYSLAYELLSTDGVIDILAEKMYQRHLANVAKAEQQNQQANAISER